MAETNQCSASSSDCRSFAPRPQPSAGLQEQLEPAVQAIAVRPVSLVRRHPQSRTIGRNRPIKKQASRWLRDVHPSYSVAEMDTSIRVGSDELRIAQGAGKPMPAVPRRWATSSYGPPCRPYGLPRAAWSTPREGA